jgi:hypothetical protein
VSPKAKSYSFSNSGAFLCTPCSMKFLVPIHDGLGLVGVSAAHRGESPWRSAMGRRQCEEEGCSKPAESGGAPHCIAHGGGRRCQEEGCTNAAHGGGTPH